MKLRAAIVLAAMTIADGAAAESRVDAKAAYDAGVKAHKHGDYQRAAEEFARADAIAPSAVALQAALNAAIRADDPALGSELLERSKREPPPPALASAVTAAHLKFKGRAGRIRVVCPSGSTCSSKLDDKPIEADKIVWGRVGSHTLTVQVDRTNQTKTVDVVADQVVEVSPTAKGTQVATVEGDVGAASAPVDADHGPARSNTDGLPPIYFYGAAGVTAVFAIVTTAFMFKTSGAHSDFEKAGCVKANNDGCQGLKDDGESSQTLANLGLAATLIGGVATAIIGVALTNWNRPLLGLGPRGPSFQVTF
jgi:hypothetical protein